MELRCQGATLSLANHSSLDPDHILHGQFHESQDVCREKLKCRRSFVPAARKLLDSLSEMDVHAAQWMNTKWDMKYSANASSLPLSFPRLAPDPWVWVCPGQPGSSSIVCFLVLDVSVRPCTNGVSLLQRIVSVVPVNKLQTTSSHSVPYIGHLEGCLV